MDRSFDKDGLTCTTCHSIQSLKSTNGNGGFVMGIPAVMVDEKGNRIPGEVPYDEIMKYPKRHSDGRHEELLQNARVLCSVPQGKSAGHA